MTIGVYGLVAGIVKLDDLGLWLSQRPGAGASQALGRGILKTAPWLMKGLSVAGTAAMFLVGGGILTHGVPALHHLIEGVVAWLSSSGAAGPALALVAPLLGDALAGLVAGALAVLVVTGVRKLLPSKAAAGSAG